ncbi:MAG: indolepyruvate oxidoreductase subunit beta [Oligoflexales bacterium]|nr:indolepyruvate oxidoreductase subunit beta [Oligoflexales bacterium]
MNAETNRSHKIIVVGVGGQGAITVAQLLMGAAWTGGYHALQSEVHGMAQRGGSVTAQVIFDKKPVTSPLIMEGTGDLLIGLEPLESLRYLALLKKDARLVVSNEPIINMDNYPDEQGLFSELSKISGIEIIDTRAHAKTLNNKKSGNMVILGKASCYLPIEISVWRDAIAARFSSKGDEVIRKNIEAFEFGREKI